MAGRAIALSGELGSGKSEVSARLARALGAPRVSTGEAQRAIAHRRGVSTLELNRLAESDPTIDDQIDGVFRSLAQTPGPLVVDSRLAWHFLPSSYKVHLVVDPAEGATRVLGRGGSHAERYESVDQALVAMEQRVESERRRFLDVYDVDIFRLDNYDLVVDTTQASPSEVADAVLARYRSAPPGPPPALLLAPGRVRGVPEATPDHGATGDEPLEAEIRVHGAGSIPPVVVAYRRPDFTVVHGRRRLRAAARCGAPLVPAVLDDADGAGAGAAADAGGEAATGR